MFQTTRAPVCAGARRVPVAEARWTVVAASAGGQAIEHGAQGSWRAWGDAESLWEALSEDAQRPLLVLSADGRVVYVNEQFSRHMGGGGSVLGKTLGEVWPAPVSAERLTLMRRALSQQRPLLLIERLKGRWSRTVIRRLPGESGSDGPPQRGGAGASGPSHVLMMFHLGAPPEGVESLADRYDIVRAGADDPGQLATLSPRELEVLALIGAGLSTRDIASKLGRTIKTVEWHRASLGRKLDITNRVELAQIAISAGLVTGNGRLRG